MKRTLTTGEMIDQLQKGDTAVSESGIVAGYEPSGILYCWLTAEQEPELRDMTPLSVSLQSIARDRWTINRQFITFNEAMDAYMNEGKTVVFHRKDEKTYEFQPNSAGALCPLAIDQIELSELLTGNWVILTAPRD